MKPELIFGQESWNKFYRNLTDRKKVFISVLLDNEEQVYLNDYKAWKLLKNYCESNNAYVQKVILSFKSNKIVEEVPDKSDGVYCIQSIVGMMGATTKKCITIGILQGNNVAKKGWTTPELLSRPVSPSFEKDCFPEGMIYNVKKRKSKAI